VQEARKPQQRKSGPKSSHSGVDFEADKGAFGSTIFRRRIRLFERRFLEHFIRHKSGADFAQAWAFWIWYFTVRAPNFTLQGPIFHKSI